MKAKNYFKYFFFVLILNFLLNQYSYSIENKIIIKIEDEIVTTLDIENEINYLIALNPTFNTLKKERKKVIATNSLVKEKIKRIEILKYIKKINLDPSFLQTLIQDRYSRLNLKNKKEFINYLKTYDINIETIENKISIEALWNQLIYQKYFSKVKIDKTSLEKEIEKVFKKGEKNYLLSEIVFEEKNKKKIDQVYLKIKKDIQNEGFENAALIHSVSESASVGGKLGWIKESSLNKIVSQNLQDLKINGITKPIFTMSRYLILKIDDIEFKEIKFDKDKELNNLIKFKTNEQLNQYSNIYFNKIKKNTKIYEF
tara:strand:- start:2304 stop:3245 length:942 start_codon:yes stop_codon:yes gene_type:complete